MTCPYKQIEKLDCLLRPARGTRLCNFLDPSTHQKCSMYWRMATLKEQAPEAWDSDKVCCTDWQQLFLECVEDTGCYQGALDIRKAIADGKNVWRNYNRIIVSYCPFCGKPPVPSPEKMQQAWRNR